MGPGGVSYSEELISRRSFGLSKGILMLVTLTLVIVARNDFGMIMGSTSTPLYTNPPRLPP